jgi:hypothetical protein
MCPSHIPTTLEQVAQAAADRAVLRGHEPDDTVFISAHFAIWRIYPADEGLGWRAMRVDGQRHDLTDVSGWLGDLGLPPAKVIDNLLGQNNLPVDPAGVLPWIDTTHPWTSPDNAWYARCPVAGLATATNTGCGLTGPVDLIRYATTDVSTVDLNQPVEVACQVCSYDFDGRLQAAPRTSTYTCPRCRRTLAAPDRVAHLRCGHCRFGFLPVNLSQRNLFRLHQLTHHPDNRNVISLPGYPRRSTWLAP